MAIWKIFADASMRQVGPRKILPSKACVRHHSAQFGAPTFLDYAPMMRVALGFLAGWQPLDVLQESDWYVRREPTPDNAVSID